MRQTTAYNLRIRRAVHGLLPKYASLWPLTLATLGTFCASTATSSRAPAQAAEPSAAAQVLPRAAGPALVLNPDEASGNPAVAGPLSADHIASSVGATGVGPDGQPLSSANPSDDTQDPDSDLDTGSDKDHGPPIGGDKSGVSSEVISVPQGSGSIQGMGESFSAQLSTGIATFSVPFALPKARGGVQPSLGLSYSSAGGFGPAGVGWSVGVPFIARQTDKGSPNYDDHAKWHPEQDRFVFNGGQELVPICVVGDPEQGCAGKLLVDPDSGPEVLPGWANGHQYFRPRIEGSFLRFFWSPDHLTWRVQDKGGTTMELGVPLDGSRDTSAVERNPDVANEIYRWHLVRQYDMYGEAHPTAGNPTPNNVVVYKYFQDGGTAFLSDIYDTPPVSIATTPVVDTLLYAHHTHLEWEARTDPTFSFRAGWRLDENLRLKGVDVTSKTFNEGGGAAAPRRLVRRYHLSYDPAYHASLLLSLQVEGRCASPGVGSVSNEVTAPAEGPSGLLAATGCGRLPPMTFDYTHVQGTRSDGSAAVADLPGYESFDESVHEVGGSPEHSLDDQQTALFDINSDSLPDVLVTSPGRFGNGHGVFFNGPGGRSDAFGEAEVIKVLGVLGAGAGDLKLSNFNVNPLDLDGDATVNLLHMPRVKTYATYTPARQANGSWAWQGRVIETASGQDPKIDFGKDAFETQTVDVNFDGLVDIVVSTGTELQTFLALGRYPGGDGQFGFATLNGSETAVISNEPIRTCVPHSSLPVSFSDKDIKLGDMNGDGIVDIVRLRRGDIQYWPGRGNGVWGTGDRNACGPGTFASGRYLTMDNSPSYSDIQETTLRLDDVNGDGLTDLIEIRFDQVDVWLNVDGRGWTERHTLQKTPASPAFASRVQIVDVNGSGTRDLLWGDGERYRYIDLAAGERPWVLSHVDNGLGKTTELQYSTSAREMLAAERDGEAWSKKMPTSVHVVKRVTESENISIAGRPKGQYTTEYSYRDPVFEGRQREFRGFSSARVKHIGDDNSPTDITESRFLLGECQDEDPSDGVDPCSVENRWRDNAQEALKGLPVIVEKSDEAGTYLSTSHKTYRLRQLYAGLDGRAVRHAFEATSREYVYDTSPFVPALTPQDVVTVERDSRMPGFNPASVISQLSLAVPVRSSAGRALITSNSVVDAFGNSLRAIANGCDSGPGCEVDDETITTYSTVSRPSGEPSGWLWRTTRSYVNGSIHTQPRQDRLTTYDAAGAALTTQATLSGTLPLERNLAATLVPIAAARSQDGLITTGTISYDDFGNVTRSTTPNAGCSAIKYDSDPVYRQLPTLELTYTAGCPADPNDTTKSLSSVAIYDRGFGQVTLVTNMQGQPTRVEYDQFARLAKLYRPDPSIAGGISSLPSVKLEYFLPPDLGPTARYSIVHASTQDGVGADGYLESYAYIDGFGRSIVTLSEADPGAADQGAWLAGNIEEYDNKAAVRRKYLQSFYNGDPKAYPFSQGPGTRYGRQRYDAFGRRLQVFDLDGTVTLQSVYHALAIDLYDAADLEAGVHRGTYTTTVKDGHGRVLRGTERLHVGGDIEARHVITQYLATGEPELIRRRRGSDAASDSVRWLRYDSLGRLILNVEPNTTSNFNADPATDPLPGPGKLKAWRYAYDDAGDIVGTSDARGCGVNFFYDGAGRLLGEDYAPCDSLTQAPYTAAATPAPNGLEVLYEYGDSLAARSGNLPAAPPGYALGSPLTRGLLIGVHDRGSSTWRTYDGRGRLQATERRIAKPLAQTANPAADWTSRYALAATSGETWFKQTHTFDASDREISATTGAVVAELTAGGQSSVFTEYSKRGTVKAITSSYVAAGAALVSQIERSADGLVRKVVYGDAAATTTSFQYDDRRRLASIQTYRGLASQWLNANSSVPGPDPNGAPSSFQLLLQDEEFSYDVVGNPTVVRDWRLPAEWPAGAKPITKKVEYDDLYRVRKVNYEYSGGDDTWTSPFLAETDADTSNDDVRRAQPTPHIEFQKRIREQAFQYDWLGNNSKTSDDAGGFYDRSLGNITSAIADKKPHQLKSATSVAGSSGTTVASGNLATSYDAAGNLLSLNVVRTGGTCRGAASCSQYFQYDWDEVGRLVRAVRRDGGPAAAIAADLTYRYDANDDRVTKTATAGAAQRHTLYVFNSLELRRANYSGNSYERSALTEVPYLFANGVRLARVMFDNSAGIPRVSNSSQHVLLELGDHLGSSSVVLDKATGELVERSAFQAYGGAESDYRPARWKGFREDYRFTGKEEDVEVGLQYFGKRYLNPLLGRWVSADPLEVHSPGQADANLYAYVSGKVLQNVDPTGLDGDISPEARETAVRFVSGLLGGAAGGAAGGATTATATSTLVWASGIVAAAAGGAAAGTALAYGLDKVGFWDWAFGNNNKSEVESSVQRYHYELQQQVLVRDAIRTQVMAAFEMSTPEVRVDSAKRQATFKITLMANSSTLRVDQGWAEEGAKRGILAVNSTRTTSNSTGTRMYSHAEGSLLDWVDTANSVGGLLGASFKMTKVGTYSRDPCGPSEEGCKIRLDAKGVPVDPGLKQTTEEIYDHPKDKQAKNRTLAIAEIEVTVDL